MPRLWNRALETAKFEKPKKASRYALEGKRFGKLHVIEELGIYKRHIKPLKPIQY